ncbi:Rv3235 family protein [Streptomyces sp. NPDC005202]|uniref:Rv3235 family protein n=1 Tax=Streptomyces sp. NPDC005202 TaxID=3157021 RepID=UPI0033BA949A
MNKVMTRNQRRPGTRPPGRHDARRPGGTPPRTPGGGLTRTTGGGRPPGPPSGGTPARTRPTDGRPPAAPGRATAPGRRGTPAQPRTAPRPTATAATTVTAAAPVVAAQTAPRPAPHPVTTDLFADRLLAVLSGQRPVHWMLRHTAGRAYDELAWLAQRGPLRARGTRPVVRDIGYFEPRPGAIEAFARISAGDQLRAMAFRLEQGRDLRWRCTAVELGGPRMPRTDDN